AVFRKAREAVRALHQAGVPLLAGTDTTNPFCYPGFSLHDELALLVGCGLSPAEALRCATRNPAEFLGEADRAGAVAAGLRAALVLPDAAPPGDVTTTPKTGAAVATGGYLPREELDRLLAAALKAAGGQPPPAAPPPQMVLANDRVKLTVYLPDARNGFYRG